MKVVLAAEALRDLESIGDHIARHNPIRARTFIRELLEKARRIAATPEAFAVVPRYAHLGIRRCVHGNYAIFYRIEGETVTVIHILHGARDVEALLFPEEE